MNKETLKGTYICYFDNLKDGYYKYLNYYINCLFILKKIILRFYQRKCLGSYIFCQEIESNIIESEIIKEYYNFLKNLLAKVEENLKKVKMFVIENIIKGSDKNKILVFKSHKLLKN